MLRINYSIRTPPNVANLSSWFGPFLGEVVGDTQHNVAALNIFVAEIVGPLLDLCRDTILTWQLLAQALSEELCGFRFIE